MNKKSLFSQVTLFVHLTTLGILSSAITLSFQDVFPTPNLIVKKLVQAPQCNTSCKRITAKGAARIAIALRKNQRGHFRRKFF